jgi:hypothetical protein
VIPPSNTWNLFDWSPEKENESIGEELEACGWEFRRVFQIHGDRAHPFERDSQKKREIRKRKFEKGIFLSGEIYEISRKTSFTGYHH